MGKQFATSLTPPLQPMERHYTPQEIADAWKLDTSTIRRIFQDRPGVLRIGKADRRDGKRDYVVLRIPESLVSEVYRKRTVRPLGYNHAHAQTSA
jgi:hypothetical protein